MSQNLDHVAIRVKDMDRAIDYYLDLGLTLEWESPDWSYFEEGCLSYPDLFIKISRPSTIVVKYEDEGKEIHKVKMTEYIARIFQHEYDHMEGIDFTQRNVVE